MTVTTGQIRFDLPLDRNVPLGGQLSHIVMQALTSGAAWEPSSGGFVLEDVHGQVLDGGLPPAELGLRDDSELRLIRSGEAWSGYEPERTLVLPVEPAEQRESRLSTGIRRSTAVITTCALIAAAVWGVYQLVRTPGAGTRDTTEKVSAPMASSASAAPTAKPSPLSHLPAGYPQPTDEWPLDDGAGNTAADTARGLPATASSTGWQWSNDPGEPGAMSFDGVSGSLALPRDVASASSERTLSIQFKTVTAGGVLLSDSGAAQGGPTTAQPVMYVGTDGRLRAEFWTGTADPITSSQRVDDGAWHTATLVGDDAAQVQVLYLDGQLIRGQLGAMTALSPQTYVGAGDPSTDRWPQASPDAVSYFRGDVREVLFYDSALSAGQVNSTVSSTTFPSDGTVYGSGAVWYSEKSTVSFVGGLLSIADATNGQTLATFGSAGHPDATMTLQASDGDLVIYPDAQSQGSQPLWTANIASDAGDSMDLQQDGNLVIYADDNTVLWAAGTNH